MSEIKMPPTELTPSERGLSLRASRRICAEGLRFDPAGITRAMEIVREVELESARAIASVVINHPTEQEN